MQTLRKVVQSRHSGQKHALWRAPGYAASDVTILSDAKRVGEVCQNLALRMAWRCWLPHGETSLFKFFVVSEWTYCLFCFSDRLNADRTIASAAVQQEALALDYPLRFQSDHNIVLTAVQQNWRAMEFASEGWVPRSLKCSW